MRLLTADPGSRPARGDGCSRGASRSLLLLAADGGLRPHPSRQMALVAGVRRRDYMTMSTTKPYILVGFDNTPASAAALRWAATEAEQRGCAVRALHVRPTAKHLGKPSETNGATRAVVDWVMRAFRRTTCSAQITIDARIGDPGPALLTAAADADLLVVGVNRDEEAAPDTNPVVGYCRRHAPCRVVTVAETGEVLGEPVG